MPLYEYQCKACGHRFEKIVKFSDPPEKLCPKCGGEVEQLLSAPAVHFKGSGFYQTDYVNKPAASGAGKSEKSDGNAASGAAEKLGGEKIAAEKPAAVESKPAATEKKE